MSYNMSTAYLSDLIYDENQVNRNTDGAEFTDPLNNTWVQKTFVTEANGYQGAVFVNAQTKQVVMVNRGTEPTKGADWGNNYQMGIGDVPDQYFSALELLALARKIAIDQGLSPNDGLHQAMARDTRDGNPATVAMSAANQSQWSLVA